MCFSQHSVSITLVPNHARIDKSYSLTHHYATCRTANSDFPYWQHWLNNAQCLGPVSTMQWLAILGVCGQSSSQKGGSLLSMLDPRLNIYTLGTPLKVSVTLVYLLQESTSGPGFVSGAGGSGYRHNNLEQKRGLFLGEGAGDGASRVCEHKDTEILITVYSRYRSTVNLLWKIFEAEPVEGHILTRVKLCQQSADPKWTKLNPYMVKFSVFILPIGRAQLLVDKIVGEPALIGY